MDIRYFVFCISLALCYSCLVLTCVVCNPTPYKHYIVVDQHHGNDTEICLNGTSLRASLLSPCKTLHYVFKSISSEQRNFTEVVLQPGTYNLTKNATFEGIFDLVILGNGSSLDIKIFCYPDVGFTFIRSGNIRLENITLSRCGTLHHSTIGSAFIVQHKNHSLFYCGVFMAYCKNVTITNSRITDSRGIGLTLYDVGGTVVLDKTHFDENTPSINESYAKENNYAIAGGGVYMEMTYDGALPPFDFNDNERYQYQHDSVYLFDNCTFYGNQAPAQYFEGTEIEFPKGSDHMPFGRGGGVSFYIKGKSSNNKFTVHGSHFAKNTALWGAGLFVEFQDETEINHLFILNSKFDSNNASLAGGGVRSGVPIWKKWNDNATFNSISHMNNVFINNQALLGAGVSHYGPFNSPVKGQKELHKFTFKECKWRNNRATLGAALGLSTGVADLTLRSLYLNPMLPYEIELENATFISNEIILTAGDKRVVGQGAVYSSGVPISFRGNTWFEKNSRTALVLDNAFIKTYGSMTFYKNNGLYGGAIGVYGLSLIELMPGVKLNFTQNYATEKGGAIYVAGNSPPILGFDTTELDLQSCFLGYNGQNTLHNVKQWKVNVTFDSNSAKKGGGNSVYAYSLLPCRRPGEPRENNKTMQWDFITYKSASNESVNIGDEISTDPIKIIINPEEWNVSPGKEFQPTIQLLDEKNSSVQGIVRLSLIPQKQSNRLEISSPLLLIDSVNSKNQFLHVKGLPCNYDLTLTTLGGQTLIKELRNLQIEPCPIGFELEKQKCTCLKNIFGVTRCSEGKNVYLLTGYWGGRLRNGEFAVFPCPMGYCSRSVTDITEKGEYLLNTSDLCAGNRKENSILCAECKKDFSVYIGSENCGDTKHCKYSTLYWFIPMFCVLSFIFVLIVLAINIEFFTVYLNTWLYSYQVLPFLVNIDECFFDDGVLSFFIGLANLKIEIKNRGFICIKGMTGMNKLLMEYSFPSSIFLVLFIIWLISKYCRQSPNASVTRAFCNLLVLVYTAVILTSFKIIHFMKLNSEWMFYFDSSIHMEERFKYVIPAGILLFLAFLIALALFLIPQFLYCVTRSPKYDSVRLIFDHFQSCFEDLATEHQPPRSHRWFAGFYFLCRFGIFIIAFYVPYGPLRRSILETACVLIAGVFLFIKPYNSDYWWLNFTDSVLLVNLCLIKIFSNAISSDYLNLNNGFKQVLQVLAYVPILYLLVLLILICWRFRAKCEYHLLNRHGENSTTTPNSEPNERSALVSEGGSHASYKSTSPVHT